MPDYGDIGLVFKIFIILLPDGKKQFIIFSTTQRTYGRVQAEFPGGVIGHGIDRDFFLIHLASFLRCFTDMQYFRRQSIRYVYHRCWLHTERTQQLNDISSSLWFQLPFNNVIFTLKIRLYVGIFQEDLFLTLQQLKAYIRSTEIPRDTDQITFLRTATVGNFFCLRIADTGYADNQTLCRSRRITT